MGSFVRRISSVAVWTMASRLLGLARDILLFASLGTGALNSAFILAFTLPNLFRRLLGEGALTSSSIPVLSESLAKRGEADAFRLFNGILTRLGLALVAILLIGIPLLGLVGYLDGLEERWYTGARLSQLLLPYMVFICLGALACGMLNVLGKFSMAALNQVWLNLCMIGAMLGGLWLMPDNGWGKVLLLCAGVLAGGVLQFLIPALGNMNLGWRPRLSFVAHPDLGKILRLFLPGLLGAAIFQINILVSRMLAFSLDDTATGLLYISSRLVELPLGVFAIAVTTVVFPELSRLSALREEQAYGSVFSRGLGLILAITLPAALGLALLGQPIVGFLFQWGLFSGEDVRAAAPVLVAAATGLPFFAWSTLLTRAWYARQELTVPVRLAAVNLLLNLLLGLLLMRIWGAVGLALANSFSSLIHCLALQYFLPGSVLQRPSLGSVLKLVAGLALLGLAVVGGRWLVTAWVPSAKTADFIIVAAVIPLSALLYMGALWILRFPPVRGLRHF